jgi:hypothetical protein
MTALRSVPREIVVLAFFAVACTCPRLVEGQVVAPPFNATYTLTNLGSVPGLPTPYGGLVFVDNDTILIGGSANNASGRLYTIDVTRDAQGHVTGFVGTAAAYGLIGEYNDGGVVFGPGGVLFTAQWPIRKLGQSKPGSTNEDAVADLAALGMTAGPGGLTFVPAGMPGAGQLKIAAYDDAKWYTMTYTPDGLGTFTLSAPVLNVTLSGGPEGIAYVPPGSTLFPNPSVLVSEYRAGQVGVYEVDASGNPIVSTRRDFVTGLTGAEGAVIDPATGDFLFSTFGGSNRVVRVSGFQAPSTYRIYGTVRTDTNQPLAGVTMTLTGSVSTTTTTAADGTYSFPGLAGSGNYTVTPTMAGRAFSPVFAIHSNMVRDERTDFVGRLVYTISGQVRDLNDTGVAGVTMTLGGSASATRTTDLNGNYAFTGLLVGGSYTVTPTRGSFTFNPASQAFPNLSKDEVAGFFVAQVGLFTRYFAEGATGNFFDTRLALLNATGRDATATVRFQRPAPQPEVSTVVTLSGLQRVSIDPKALGLTSAEFSTVIEADQPIIADRTMTWNATGYGSHAETSIGRPLTEWFFAEGATISGFDLFYLIQNPNTTAADVEVRYLLPAPLAPVVKTYTVSPLARFNIWVNTEGAPLDNAEMSAAIRVTNGVPVIVERAMYRGVGAQFFGAGHESAGVEAPRTAWFFAEGATGDFFDLFFLIANPNAQPSEVVARYLKPDGSVVTKSYTVPGDSRFNIWVDYEDHALADTAVGTSFTVTNGVPVVAERAMWWAGAVANWYEGHNTAGATASGEKWGLAEGEVGGPTALETYILVANVTDQPGTVRVTLTFEDGTQAVQDYAMPPSSRLNVPVGFDFPESAGKRFGAVVESLGASPVQIVVERAMYNNAGGTMWAAGTSALATKLR